MTPTKEEWDHPCPRCGGVVLTWCFDESEGVFVECSGDTCDYYDAF